MLPCELTFVPVVRDLAEVQEVRADDGHAHVVALHELGGMGAR